MNSIKEFSHDDELCLYARNGVYQARVYAGDRKYVTRSLKTRDVSAARKLAERFYYETKIKLDAGDTVSTVTWAKVVREYVAAREAQYVSGVPIAESGNHRAKITLSNLRQVRRVSKFWLEYRPNTALATIDNSWLRDYVSWRRDYYPSRLRAGVAIHKAAKIAPADKTLLWETTFAKTVLRWSAERGYIRQDRVPKWNMRIGEPETRPAFEREEYRALMLELNSDLRHTVDPQRRYTKQLLLNYVATLALSGMRVGEANNLRVSDVVEFTDSNGRPNYMFKVRGKTGERVVIPRVQLIPYIMRQLALWKSWQEERAARGIHKLQSYSRESGVTVDWLFKMPDGGQVVTLARQFDDALGKAGIKHNADGESLSLYSLRHMYAVGGLRRGTPVWDLSRNMGTSVDMIAKHYGKSATPLALATSLGN